jgi:hypothetical protein
MKNKMMIIGFISILVGVLLVDIAVLGYLLIKLGTDIWQTFTNPIRLASMFREILGMMGSLGVCCTGIILLFIIIGIIPHKWWHGGIESSNDEDDDPYYRYM